jgi:hypothetical protein
VEELRQVFLFIAGWYYRELHQKPHTLFSVALIEIKIGDMAGSGAMSGAQEGGVDHAPLDKLPEIMRPTWPHSQKMVLGSPLTELNSRNFSFFETELFCGRHDSTNFDGERYLSKSWHSPPSMVSA